jgi:predicted nucleic acid-binding protein
LRRLFLDANVLFTAAHNPGGKAALVIELGARGHWEVITSIYAVAEARHNLRCKYPDALKALDDLIETIAVVPSGPGQICPVPLPGKDRPILEAAIRHQASHLLTGDIKDFGAYMNRPEMTAGVTIQTVSMLLSSIE